MTDAMMTQLVESLLHIARSFTAETSK
jgi:hypothetical protein